MLKLWNEIWRLLKIVKSKIKYLLKLFLLYKFFMLECFLIAKHFIKRLYISLSNAVYHAKHAQNSTQVVLKVFDLDLIITSHPTEVSLKGIPSNKRHFTLTLRMIKIMVWVIGKLPSSRPKLRPAFGHCFRWFSFFQKICFVKSSLNMLWT